MPYGTPVSDDSNATYTAEVGYTAITGSGAFRVTYQYNPDHSQSEREATFQAFVDLIDGSTDFGFTGVVTKTYPTYQEVTPTP